MHRRQTELNSRKVALLQHAATRVSLSDRAEMMQTEASVSEKEFKKSKARVLVVDDHEAIRDSLVMMVDVYAEVCGTAANGEEAVARAEELKPDVILMDIKMPVVDGITATLVIKKRFPDIKVIAHTAYADRHLSEQMLAAGADDYMLKGGDLGELLESLFGDGEFDEAGRPEGS